MKKYLLIGGAGLVGVVVIAFVMFQQDKIDLPETLEDTVISSHVTTNADAGGILEQVPGDFEQAVVMDVDAGLTTVMERAETSSSSTSPYTYGSGFQEAMRDINHLIAVQYATDMGAYSLLFVDAADKVALQKIQEMGVVAGDQSYQVKQLNDQLRVYGNQPSLDFYEQYSGPSAAEDTAIAPYLQDILGDMYNIGFASKPLMQQRNQNNPMVQQFAQQLSHTVVRSHLAPEDIYGEVILQFAPGVIPESRSVFTPELATQAPADSLIYLEIADLLGMFAIGEEQFINILPALMGQSQAFGAALSSDQFSSLYDVLSDHIAVSIAPATNMFGVGAEVFFAHSEAFSVMNSLRPLWLGVAGGVVGTGTLQPLPADEGFAYGITGLPVAGDQPVIALSRQDEVAKLSVLGAASDDRGISGLPYGDDTAITFKVDSAGLQEQLSSSAMNPLAPTMGSLEQSANYFNANILQGEVQLVPDDNQLRINFTVVE